jgi:hypothetical protein
MTLRWIFNKQVVNGLANLRREWQDASVDSLTDVDGNVGLLLGDVCDAIGLDPSEKDNVLGIILQAEISDVLAQQAKIPADGIDRLVAYLKMSQ